MRQPFVASYSTQKTKRNYIYSITQTIKSLSKCVKFRNFHNYDIFFILQTILVRVKQTKFSN